MTEAAPLMLEALGAAVDGDHRRRLAASLAGLDEDTAPRRPLRATSARSAADPPEPDRP
jgi:hypothetical protein